MWPRDDLTWVWLFVLALLAAAPAAAQPSIAPTGPETAKIKAAEAESDVIHWRVFQNTAILCAGVVLIAVPLGTLLSIVLSRTDVPGRRTATALVVFLLFLPLYVQVAGWEAAFGKLGWLTSITRTPLLAGMGAVIFIHAMAAIPWVVLIVSIGLRLVRRAEEEVALLDASGPQVVARIVLPQIAPYLLAATLLAAISAAGEMTVTNIYLIEPGDYTLAEQVYMTLQSQPLSAAVQQSLFSILATVLLVAGGVLAVGFLAPLQGRFTEDRYPPLVYPLGPWRTPATILVWLLLAALVGLPLVSMVYKAGTLVVWQDETPLRTWSAWKSLSAPWIGLWQTKDDFKWTLIIAAAAATLDLALAIGLARTARRGTWSAWFLLAVVAIAWALPGPIVGLGIIALFHHDVAGLAWLYNRTDVPSILAQAVRAAPIVMLVVWQAMDRFPKSALDAAQLDGAGPGRILWRIILPQRLAALFIAWLAGFAVAAGDLAWSILVLRPGIDTLQRRLFDLIHAGADDRVAAICLAISALYGIAAAVTLWARRLALAKPGQNLHEQS